jgi:hypothetical protein
MRRFKTTSFTSFTTTTSTIATTETSTTTFTTSSVVACPTFVLQASSTDTDFPYSGMYVGAGLITTDPYFHTFSTSISSAFLFYIDASFEGSLKASDFRGSSWNYVGFEYRSDRISMFGGTLGTGLEPMFSNTATIGGGLLSSTSTEGDTIYQYCQDDVYSDGICLASNIKQDCSPLTLTAIPHCVTAPL